MTRRSTEKWQGRGCEQEKEGQCSRECSGRWMRHGLGRAGKEVMKGGVWKSRGRGEGWRG